MIGPQGQPGGWRVWRTVTFGMFALRGASGVARSVATSAAEGNAGAQRLIDRLPAAARPPSGPEEGNVAARVVFGRSGYPDEAKRRPTTQAQGDDAGTKRQSGPGQGEPAPGSSGSGPAQTPPVDADTWRRIPGLHLPPYDRDAVDNAGERMHEQAMTSPTSAEEVTHAMSKLPREVQLGIGEVWMSEPLKLRDSIAHHLHSPQLTDSERNALWTIGASRGKAAEHGIHSALSNLQGSGTHTASTEGPASSQQRASAGSGPRAPEEQPPSTPPSSAPCHPEQPARGSQTAPPTGASTLGSNLAQPRSETPPQPAHEEPPKGSDTEPASTHSEFVEEPRIDEPFRD